MTSIQITSQHINDARQAVDGAIFITPDNEIYGGSRITPADGEQGRVILATSDDLAYWIGETDTLDEAAAALTAQLATESIVDYATATTR